MSKPLFTRLALVFILLALLPPQLVKADEVTDKNNYEITLGGQYTIKFKLPVKRWTGNHVDQCYVRFTVEGDNEVHKCFSHFGYTDDEYKRFYGVNPGDDEWGNRIYVFYPTRYVVTPSNCSPLYLYGPTEETFLSKANKPGKDSEKWWGVEVEWTVPGELRGKTLNFTWDVRLQESSNSVKPDPVSISVPGPGITAPTLTQPMLMMDEIGKIGYTWFVSVDNITKASASWKSTRESPESVMPLSNENNGTVLLDACVPHYQFHVDVDYKTDDGQLIQNNASDAVDVPMLHAPKKFKATPQDDGKGTVLLTWDVSLPDYPDIMDTDFFLIERSLTGLDEDFETLTAEPYTAGEEHFEYKDETLLKSLSASQLTATGNIPTPKYRICRSSTSQWGWYGNPSALTTEAIFAYPLKLLTPTGGMAAWADLDAHTMKVSWDYLPSANITSPVQPSGTLLGSGTEADPYLITSDADWETFANWILTQNGTYADKHYRLDADIAITTMVGDYEATTPFKGTFNGNGHTLYVDLVNDGNPYTAPFRSADGATIKNLRTIGNVSANSEACAAGIVARLDGTSTIDNCWSSVNIYGKRSGNGSHGGLVGHAGRGGGTFTVTNCRYDGTIYDPTATKCGGLVGYVYPDRTLTFNNCMMAGTLTTGAEDCATLARAHGTVVVDNCYYVTAYGKVQGNPADAMTNEALVENLPGWVIDKNGQVVPNLGNNINTTLIGSGTASTPYQIASDADWEIFADLVNSKNDTHANKYYQLTTDIAVTTSVGSEKAPFKGVFDGNGHTITANLKDTDHEGTAVFRYISNATIQNLKVDGTVTGGKHCAGIVGFAWSGTNTIKSCLVTARVECIGSDLTRSGGILGHGKSSNTTITDCAFYGTITGSITSTGIIYGWHDAGGTHSIVNCLSAGTYTGCDGIELIRHYRGEDNINNCYSKTAGGSQGTDASQMTNEELKNKLGSEWTVWNNIVVPTTVTSDLMYAWDNRAKMTLRVKTFNRAGQLVEATDYDLTATEVQEKVKEVQLHRSCVEAEIELLVNSGSSPLHLPYSSAATDTAHYAIQDIPEDKFRFELSGKVEKTIMAETRQSSVVLTWNTDGDVIDFFEVLRKRAGEDDSRYEVIATDLTGMSYEDKTVLPLEDYIYKVRSAVDCEGLSYNESNPVAGACKHSGKLEGRVQYPDGTGVAGLTVSVASEDGKKKVEVTTDEDGHYVAEGLPYINGRATTYNVTPVSKGQMALEVGSMVITFDSEYNYFEMKTFNVTSAHRFSGYVMYAGTSIPVKGASFKVNGYQARKNGGKPVETDFEGKFSFYVGSGNNVIQAEMPQHRFTDGGYFKSKNGYFFDGDVDNIYFYDDTKVKLIGRIVGGDTQGDLPLDHNISRNNLGTGVKMVLTLEGDNTSWLVYDNLNPEKSVNDYTIAHADNDGEQKHQTRVHTTRKRMEVAPDSLTGEYRLELPPVRWKVQQVYSDGYPTLFQEGMVSEVIDLTDCLTEQADTAQGKFTTVGGHALGSEVVTKYQAKYNRIYHTPLELLYQQKGYDNYSYLGDKVYYYRSVDGNKLTIPVAEADATQAGGVKYTFGHPVFSIGVKYPLQLSAVERYYWNNDQNSNIVDVVKVGGGQVTVQNDFKLTDKREVVELNDEGEGTYNLTVEQIPYLLKGEDALRTVTMTLLQDGTNYEAKPVSGYVFNIFSRNGASDVISIERPQLVDVLRDPPGGKSYATLHKGSVLKTGYTMDMSFENGLNIYIDRGKEITNFQGAVSAPQGAGVTYGILNETQMGKEPIEIPITWKMKGNRSFYYTVNVENDISTSSAPTMVGAPADLYIGMVQNMTVKPASTIRAIPDNVFKQMAGQLGGYTLPDGSTQDNGSLVEIAQGTAQDGSLYHLVRDESLMYGQEVKSTFVHSQDYIVKQIIPALYEKMRSLMFIGTEQEAQQLANSTGKAIYRSLVPADDENFAMPDQYKMYRPSGVLESNYKDEVNETFEVMREWVRMIEMNEQEKVKANTVWRNFDIDGGGALTYSENFANDYSVSNFLYIPVIKSPQFYDASGADAGLAVGSMIGLRLFNALLKEVVYKRDNPKVTDTEETDQEGMEYKVKFNGSYFKFGIYPILVYDTEDRTIASQNFNRKESFTIDMDEKSHLDFDVFTAETRGDLLKDENLTDVYDVFDTHDFYHNTDYVNDYIGRKIDTDDLLYARSFVYRTRGGATANPWEDARKTVFYAPGTLLDERTKKIENPKIKLDKQSVSGVSHSEPARFTIYLTNESEQPEAATDRLSYYMLYLNEQENKNGAKLMIDGMPLTGDGRMIQLQPGTVTQKTLEVYAGEEFDYEGLTIGVRSKEDYLNTWDEVKFDVHYLRTAGNVDIASPADKWIMNTDAEYNNERGYFIPVVISGFDKHQKNFDHIEFQYKETARGDDYWTNLCSYYADSTLMAKANGIKELIPENGNITAQFFGEGVVFEKAYDLRAVLYCRNGNSFLTTASKVMSGVKDTRRPQLFGSPEPVNGIVGAGENIVFNFSEDIEYNYLSSITNFEVKGEVNNDAVTRDISLRFDGNGYVETEAERNFADKNLTIDLMIHPDQTGKAMPLFSHGSDGKKLQFWLTEDYRLKAIVNDKAYVSDSAIVPRDFTLVGMVIRQPEETGGKCRIEFYNGGIQIGDALLDEAYTGTGVVTFGSTNEVNPSQRSYYSGRMMEARLWYRALDGGLIGTTYGYKRLTGYERGLMDYWPMTDGFGDYAIDKAQGANLQIGSGVAWSRPDGMSLRLTAEDQGIGLTPMAINRTAEQDYTLMFWFKNDGKNGTMISNGSGRADEEAAKNRFFIGFENEQLKYRSNGLEMEVPGDWADGDWHHYAMTVNRAMNVVNIYVDQTLRNTVEPDDLGGISGGSLKLGSGGFAGRLDEVCLFDQALPLTLIKSYSTHSPQGDEAGLITYLGFQRQERSQDNDIVTVPYVYSKKVYKDLEGNVVYERDPQTQLPTTTPQRDYLFKDGAEAILSHIDQTQGAPVMPEQELHNLSFSFVGRDHSILLNINNSDEKINKRNIYVTLRDIPDKNGNAMASAATACFFIDRNPLRWKQKNYLAEQEYGSATTFTVAIQNNSQMSHTYTIENYPRWLTVSPYTNTITPTEEQLVTFTVNKDLNVGRYDEIIYLTDENGLSEPMVLSLEVNGIEPDWTNGVDRALRQHSMNITARVILNNEIDTEPEDKVGVFDMEGVCHGVSSISYDETTGESLVYITVYDSLMADHEMYFRLWNHSIGKEQMLVPRDDEGNKQYTVMFQPSKVIGSPSKPLILTGGDYYIQTIALYKGWNWVSLNVLADVVQNYNSLLGRLPMHEGDIMADVSGAVNVFTNGRWMTSASNTNTSISHKSAYFVKVQEDVNLQLYGTLIKERDDRTITVHNGWNGIGYTPMLNLTVETALTDYNNKAEEGDVIKSHDEYAIFTVNGGVGRWKGSLKYMKPGEGYMLYRTKATEASFTYPFYEPTSTFLDEVKTTATRRGARQSNMSLTAKVNGIELQEGDRLKAYSDGELCGEIGAEDDIFYLSVSGDKDAPISFAIERDGEIIATTTDIMRYHTNDVIGSPDQPTAIDFTRVEVSGTGWFTMSGTKLNGKPTRAGVYIHNGKKEVVK